MNKERKVFNWSIPDNVGFAISTRHGGVSLAPFDSFNLGDHVGDDPAAVAENRQRLITQYQLPTPPAWLNQVHGTDVLQLPLQGNNTADASYSNQQGQVCVVMTADCLPILLCNQAGTEIAAIHAGWRSLCYGVIENTIKQFQSPPDEIIVLLGPCIGAEAFEVGSEVRAEFLKQDSDAFFAFMARSTQGKYLGNLPLLAKQRLQKLGVHQISDTGICTFQNSQDYYSYRKENHTGRFASLIWLRS